MTAIWLEHCFAQSGAKAPHSKVERFYHVDRENPIRFVR